MARSSGQNKKTEKVGKSNAATKPKTKTAEAKKPAAPRKPRTEIKAKASKAPSTAAGSTPSFMLYEPHAREVFIAGCFNEWNPAATPLQKDASGTWFCMVDLEPGRHEYRFVVDGEWRDDPLNTVRCANEFGTENCVVIIEE